MSKGSESAAVLAATHGWECLPRQWWTVSKKVRDAVKANTFKGEDVGRFLEWLIDCYFEFDKKWDGVLMAHHITLDGVPFLVGYSGRFGKSTLKEIFDTVGHDPSTVDI